MKKILLSASVCMLALFAGCTRDIADNGNAEQDKDAIQFFGSTDTDATKVTFGDADQSTTKVPILWNTDDAIGIFSSEYKLFPDKPDNDAVFSQNNKKYLATTKTAAASTGFKADFSAINTKNQGVSFWAYYPYTDANMMKTKETVKAPIKSVQNYDVATSSYPDRMFMVANEAVADAHKVVKFKFTNVFALINVGVKGDAKIDSIKISGFTKTAACNDASVNITKAPAAGSDAAAFNASKFLERVKDDTSDIREVTMKIGSSLRLDDNNVHYIPLMVLPTEFDSNVGLTVTIYGTDKEGKAAHITRTGLGKVDAGAKAIKTNDIIYVNLKPITSGELNQDAPKTSFDPGTEMFADDFSWIAQLMDTENAKPETPDTGGEPSEPGFPPSSNTKNNYLKTGYYDYNYVDRFTADGKEKSYVNYMTAESSTMRTEYEKRYMFNNDYSSFTFGFYTKNGIIKLGNLYGGNANVSIPVDLERAKENLTVTFKASACNKDIYGNDFGGALALTMPVTVVGDGTIKGGTAKSIEVNLPEAPAWSEYTVVVEGATANTQIQIGGNGNSAQGVYLLDDIKIVIAAAADANNTAGTSLGAPAASISDIMPADGNVSIGWNKGSKSVFSFSMTGTWVVTGLPSWLAIKPDWDTEKWQDTAIVLESNFANELPNFMKLYVLETNPTGQPRVATVTVTSKEDSSVKHSFTITQAATPAKETLLSADFGTVTGVATPIIKDVINWGATLGQGVSIVDNFDKDGKNTKIELSNETLISALLTESEGEPIVVPAAVYPGATPGGCYNFKAIKSYDAWSTPEIGFGFTIPTEGKTLVTVSFGMYLHYGKGYNVMNYINVYDDQGYNTIENSKLVEGWNYYTVTLPVVDNAKTKTITIFPPTDGRNSRANSVLLDDVKVEIQ